jgi:ABC-2 type transport system permease protein
VIGEKNSKIMEVLLSSVTPRQLMTGKILGLGGAGLTVITLWSIVGYWAARFRHFDVASLPNLGFFVIFFLLGYAFYGTLMSAVGSVCNSEKEAQQMLAPIMLLLVIPLVVWFYIAQRPEGTMARTLSMIPFTIPTVMMLRIGLQTPPGGEIAISIGVMLVSIPIVMWASVRVFRTGILMYGKKPRLREIIRWIRHK